MAVNYSMMEHNSKNGSIQHAQKTMIFTHTQNLTLFMYKYPQPLPPTFKNSLSQLMQPETRPSQVTV